MQGLVEYAMYVYQGKIPISTEGMLVISGSVPGTWDYLTVWSTSRSLSLLAAKLLCKAINPEGRQKLHIGESNQQKSPGGSEKPVRPVFSLSFFL